MNFEQTATPPEPHWKVAVIGGGLTGLSAAHRIGELCREHDRKLELTLIDASSRTGGIIATRQIGDYLVETGADSFITNKPWAVDLCRRLGLEDRLISTDATYRRSLVLRNGKPVPVPDGFMLLAPARFWPVLTSSIFSLGGKLRMGMEYCIPRRTDDDDESLADFVRRRFGQQALDRLVQPLVGGIYTSDPEKLSLKATLPRFIEWEQQYRSLIRASRKQSRESRSLDAASGSGARYGLFATLAGGVSELLDRLEKTVLGYGTIRLETPIVEAKPIESTHPAGHRWELRFADGNTESFDAVVLAMRSYHVAELVSGFDSQLAKDLKTIEYASSAIVVTGHRLADVRNPLNAFGLVIPAIENRKILAVSFGSRKFSGRAPDGRVILRTFVGGAMQPELFETPDDKLTALVRKELEDILGVTGEEDFSMIVRFQAAMPQYHVGHLDRVAKIESRAAKHGCLELAGNAYHGVGIPDCIHSGEQAAERLFANSKVM